MINISSYIKISPRIVHSYSLQLLTVTPKYNFITLSGEYEITILPKHYYYSTDRVSSFNTFIVSAKDNKLEFAYDFEHEQEYKISIVPYKHDGVRVCTIQSSIYALDNDLYSRKVIKGDLHLHTIYSDGVESPEHRIAIAREHGMDYLAITDHSNYEGSKRAIQVISKCPNNMIMLHGEEVHADCCPVHILSLGAHHAITPLVTNRNDAQKISLQKVAKAYETDISEDVDAYSFASAMDVFEKIKEAHGLSVLCHIYWDAIQIEAKQRMGVPEQLINALVEHCAFDAFEITSGAPKSDLQANYLQEAYYREKLPNGFPVIGITDSHSTAVELGSIFGKNYTIAFVQEFTENGILKAIRDYHTVAIDGVSEYPICHGSLRLIKYATFLLREYFPIHDEMVAIEGICMKRFLLGDDDALIHQADLCKDNITLLSDEWGVIIPNKYHNIM